MSLDVLHVIRCATCACVSNSQVYKNIHITYTCSYVRKKFAYCMLIG